MKKAQTFTLIELIVCIGLITMAASLFGVKGFQMYQHSSRLHELDALLDEIALTRNLAHSLRADVHLSLRMNPQKRLVLQRDADEPILVKMQQTILKPRTFKHLSIADELDIHYFGNGWSNEPTEITISGIVKKL